MYLFIMQVVITKLAKIIPNFPKKENLFKTCFTLDKEGITSIPDSPEIGFEINFEVLDKYRTCPVY